MKRFIFVMLGLALIAICVTWFSGLWEQILSSTPTRAPSSELQPFDNGSDALRRARPRREMVGGIDINTVLNFVNAIIGAVGLYLTVKAGRTQTDRSV
ncbi:MAG: hypothetical protein AAFZ01_08625 [Pseudomonadota bacterium]